MKYFAAIVLLALFAVAFIEAKPKPAEVENIEPESGAASPDMRFLSAVRPLSKQYQATTKD